MTIDEAVEDALGKTTHRSSIAARYAVRRNSKFFGYVEAHIETHASQLVQDWVVTWELLRQDQGGKITRESAEELEDLLRPYGEVDLMPAMASAPGFGKLFSD
jgi:hypothetical protein